MGENNLPAFDFSAMAAPSRSLEPSPHIEIIDENDSTIINSFEVTLNEEETAHKSTIQALRDLRDYALLCGPKLKRILEELEALNAEKRELESRMQLLEKEAETAVERSIHSLSSLLNSAKIEVKK